MFYFSAQKKIYKDQMEFMLHHYVFPLFRNVLGYMRARVRDFFENKISGPADVTVEMISSLTTFVCFRLTQACWVLHYFCEVKFKSDHNLQTALELTRLCLINDNEMPVKVEAAIALQVLISNQEKGKLDLCSWLFSTSKNVLNRHFIYSLYFF